MALKSKDTAKKCGGGCGCSKQSKSVRTCSRAKNSAVAESAQETNSKSRVTRTCSKARSKVTKSCAK